jgi:DNA adenine methylase
MPRVTERAHATPILRPPVRWYGGKRYLAKWIIGHFPEHDAYLEAFGGGASVLLNKKPASLETYNDLDRRVSRFFRVLRNQGDAFLTRVRRVPYSQVEFVEAVRYPKHATDLDKAVCDFTRWRQSFAGAGRSWSYSVHRSRGGMAGDVHGWWSAIELLPQIIARLQCVQITCEPATDAIRRFDHRNALIYCDPPYVHRTRDPHSRDVYAHEMSDDEHRELASVLRRCRGKVVVSGYPSPLYRTLYRDWRQLQERGIELVSVMQPNIDASPVGRLVDTVLAGVNQYQSEEKADRILIAMEKKFEQGQWPGWAPLGYLNVQESEKRTITTDPDRFELVRFAFREYASGRYTQEELRDLLTAKGLRDRNDRPLSRTSLNNMLRNPFYAGRMRWNGVERMGAHTPATDRHTWERCQQVTAEHNKYASRRRKHTFLLTGLLVCEECGRHLTHTVNVQKRKRYYHCPSRAQCHQSYVPDETVEHHVSAVMSRTRLTDECIALVIERVRDVFEQRTALHEQQKAVLLRRRTVVEQKRDAAEQKLLAGVLTDDAFRRLTPKIRREIDDVNEQIVDIESARRFNTDALQEILGFARDIPSAYAEAPLPVKRRYLHFFFREFVVRDRQVVRAIPTELFEALLGEKQVRTLKDWCTRLNVNLTQLIRLFGDPEWVQKQREVLPQATHVA